MWQVPFERVSNLPPITGRVKSQTHSLARAVAYMVKQGYLTKPEWMADSKLTISLFPTDQLMDAYEKLSQENEPF